MHLLRDYNQFDRCCSRIERLVDSGLEARARSDGRVVFETYLNQAIITLHDAWAFRCRAVVLKSARGNIRTISGKTLSTASSHPLETVRNAWGKREPPWYVPRDAIRAAEKLKVANIVEIRNGLGACVAADDVRITRNVIAHSLPATWAALRKLQKNYGHHGNETAAEFAVCRTYDVGSRHIEEWIADLKACLRAAIE